MALNVPAISYYGALADVSSINSLIAAIVNGTLPVGGNLATPTVSSASNATWNAATIGGAFLSNTILVRSGGAALTDTTDTATNIIAAIPQAVQGQKGLLVVANLNSGTLTLGAGTGVTLAGTTTIATAGLRFYSVNVTNVATPAVTITGLFTIGSGVAA